MKQIANKPLSTIISGIPYLLALVLFSITADNAFFWDSIQLGSLHAHHYYDTNFSELLLPNHIDSGHIPFFGAMLAALWMLFGKTLFIGHLLMFILQVGIIWQLNRLMKWCVPSPYVGMAVLMVYMDVSILGHSVIVSPDNVLMLCFLLGLNSILLQKRYWLVVATIFLFLISMRGMMVATLLLIIDVVLFPAASLRQWLQKGTAYIPSLLIFLGYNYWHYYEKGWIAFHDESPWAESFAVVGVRDILINIAVYGWRLLDFGRVAVWIIGCVCLAQYYTKQCHTRLRNSNKINQLLVCTLLFLTLFPIALIWAKNLVGHRYLLPVLTLVAVSVCALLFSNCIKPMLRNAFIVAWITMLIGGQFWIYPDRISQGWDSTLAHLPYDHLRDQMIDYIHHQQIDLQHTCSFFPNLRSFEETDLNGDPSTFQPFDPTCRYVIYSNIYNVSDQEYQILMSDYEIVTEFRRHRIFIRLLKHK